MPPDYTPVDESDFIITYESDDGEAPHNVPPEAMAAIDKACELWTYLIATDVPIKIRLNFKEFPDANPDDDLSLNGATTTFFAHASQIESEDDNNGHPFTGLYYPSALADKLAKVNLSSEVTGSEYDMSISLNLLK